MPMATPGSRTPGEQRGKEHLAAPSAAWFHPMKIPGLFKTGWWFQPTPLKNMSSSMKVNWDDDILNTWKKCPKPLTSYDISLI